MTAKAYKERNREKMREYMRTYRAGGWPPGKRGAAWERIFIDSVRGVIGLEPLPVTSQFDGKGTT